MPVQTSAARPVVRPLPRNLRARVTNASKMLVGVDGRSAEARRFKDLVDSFAEALGGEAALTEVQRTAIRRASELTTLAEQQRARALRGESVDPLALVRLEGMTARAVRALGITSDIKPRRRSLLAQLAENRAQ
jgi:ribosomal protein L13E